MIGIAFETRTKTAEPIEVVFGVMTQVGPRYQEKSVTWETNFGVNVTAHCNVMGHSTVSYAKTAEPIEMPFWMKTRVDPRNHELNGVQIPQGKGAIVEGCLNHSNALAIFAAASLPRSLQKGSFNRQ